MKTEEERGKMLDFNEDDIGDLSPDKKAMFGGTEVEDVEFEEATEPEESDTETETVDKSEEGDKPEDDKDTDTETETEELTDEQKLLAEYGLDKRFPGGVKAALASIKEQNTRNEHVQQENSQLRQLLDQLNKRMADKPSGDGNGQATKEELAELFYNNPTEAVKQLRLVDEQRLIPLIQTLQGVVAENHWSKTVNSVAGLDDPDARELSRIMQSTGNFPKPGENALYDELLAEYRSNEQAYGNIEQPALMRLLYKVTRGNQPKKGSVSPVSKTRKQRATTVGSRPAAGDSEFPDMSRWSADKIRSWYAERGMID